MRSIGRSAFSDTPLRSAHFLGTTARELRICEPSPGHPSGETEEGCSSNEQTVIGEKAFANCKGLEQVIFDPDSAVTEMQCKAFWDSGLKTFAAPPSLRKICTLAFRECRCLETFELNEDIQELGWLCLWCTGITDLRLP